MLRLTMLAFVVAGSASTFVDAGERVTVTTLDWPPYTAESLPKGGATTEVLRRAFKEVELELDVVFLPWKRAISMAKHDAGAIAYYPGYHCRHVDGFITSEPIGKGPLGFAEHAQAPIVWHNLDHIGEQKLKIGTVLGYANTDDFDQKAGTGWIRAIPAPDDITNLKKLLRRRIDAVVIDKLVLSYLVATEPALSKDADALQFNQKTLEDKTLYLCFTDDDAGRSMRDKFNAGLENIDFDEVVDGYFANEF